MNHRPTALEGQRGVTIAELAVLMGIIGILSAMMFPLNNFNYLAASIAQNGIAKTSPLRTAIEEYYFQHGHFPDSGDDLNRSMVIRESADHVKSITIGSGGRITIAFDTSDIDWGWWSRWQRVLFLTPNDLTGQTLVLVPEWAGSGIIWDECEEGTVPKRNRHYKCSGHR